MMEKESEAESRRQSANDRQEKRWSVYAWYINERYYRHSGCTKQTVLGGISELLVVGTGTVETH
jgi:uncharacterized metal-binding protein